MEGGSLDVKELKNYIYENNYCEQILESVGCHHIKYHSVGAYWTAGNPDGDNKGAIILYNNESLICLNKTRQMIKGNRQTDIIDLVCYVKDLTFPEGLNDFTYNKDNHLITDVAFLDEGSMVNASLFLHWLEAIGDNTRIIISGDHKQLPPIGFGNVFSDLIEMFDDSVVSKLVKPMRQAEKSGILVDANKIRENINPISEKLQPRIIHGE